MSKRIMKYNPAFLTDEELLHSFAVRQIDFDTIIRVIRENTTNVNQHVLVIGPRGIGKTTLLLRIGLEARTTEDLKGKWYPLVFAEESYSICSVGEFWLEALFHVAQQTGDKKWGQIIEELNDEKDDKRLGDRALAKLLDFADSQGKRILLIIENFNMLFDGQIAEQDAWTLRHTLINEPRIMLLASATSHMEQVDNSGSAMYELFKQHILKPLVKDECIAVWEAITGKHLKDDRIRPIQILTGGNPRLLSIISSFGSKLSFQDLMGDLLNLVDDNTEYFKSHLDNLPPIERKAYLALAELWDPAPAKDIARLARLDVNKTSSLMARLVSRGAVTVIEGGKRAKLYQTTERMYNIYYLMRKRGAPSERVKAVVNFMVSFYGHDELLHVTKKLAEEACGLAPELCKDHVLTYDAIINRLSSQDAKHQILRSTPTKFLTLCKEHRFSYDLSKVKKQTILNKNGTCLPRNKIEYDSNKIESLELYLIKKPNDCEALKDYGLLLEKKGNFVETEKIYRKLITLRPKCPKGWGNLGLLLHSLNRFEEAEESYKIQIKNDPKDYYIWAKYGQLLDENLKRFEDSEKAYKKALKIQPDYHWAWEQLGLLLANKFGRYEEAANAYYKAIESEDDCSVVWHLLGSLLSEKMHRPEEAEHAYIKAFEIASQDILKNPSSTDALNSMGWALYKYGRTDSLQQAKELMIRATIIDPEDALVSHTYGCILSALDMGEEALVPTQKYIQNTILASNKIDDTIELFAGLTAAGSGLQALDMLTKSTIVEKVEPLVVGIRLYLGEEVQVATEILEVAKDVRQRIQTMRDRIEARGKVQKAGKSGRGKKAQ